MTDILVNPFTPNTVVENSQPVRAATFANEVVDLSPESSPTSPPPDSKDSRTKRFKYRNRSNDSSDSAIVESRNPNVKDMPPSPRPRNTRFEDSELSAIRESTSEILKHPDTPPFHEEEEEEEEAEEQEDTLLLSDSDDMLADFPDEDVVED
jgi:hypothetical protein